MATTNYNAENKRLIRKRIIGNLTLIVAYLILLFLAGVEYKQRYEWSLVWWYLTAISFCVTVGIMAVCLMLSSDRFEFLFGYYEERRSRYFQLCVLLRAAFSVTVLLSIYTLLVVTFELKYLGGAVTALTTLVLFFWFKAYFRKACGLDPGPFDFLKI